MQRLDTRLEYDITSTIHTDSKIEVFNGSESRKRIIARFPIGEIIDTFDSSSRGTKKGISEIVNVGLEDLTRSNPDTQTLMLMNGEILILNTKIECRYMHNKTIVTKPADFSGPGFFYLQLLFSKRLK